MKLGWFAASLFMFSCVGPASPPPRSSHRNETTAQPSPDQPTAQQGSDQPIVRPATDRQTRASEATSSQDRPSVHPTTGTMPEKQARASAPLQVSSSQPIEPPATASDQPASAPAGSLQQQPPSPTPATQPAQAPPAGAAGQPAASAPVESAQQRPPPVSATQLAAQTPTAEAKPSSGNPEVDDILDRLEAKGQAIKGLACNLVYKYVTVEPVEDAQIKVGELLFAVDQPNAKFLIHFDKMIAEGIVIPRHEYFLFDGGWLVERNDKARTVIRRQIVRTGERIDPFKVGKGPFPLPFGQKREDILRNFKIDLRPFELGDPRNARHLHCVPLPDSELASKYSRVDIYVDRKIELPVRIVSERLTDGNRIEVDFQDINTNEAPAKSRFQIEVPEGFDVSEEPLPPVPSRDSVGHENP